ncbi:nucleotidyltransferase family protein [Herbaspirillum sp. WKF16]|jgi:mannose-1-phosphate guanylyltransferase|uniref:nucleotidyltransferase family protein n=1 Tax=Herbaspirillum sp. WKF16 TaxID=3028312 RepID=UPI0023A994E0|nr:nucleotidyltransferase family protein [Herbaspirillum sp. WKF16]WDZ94299.1 nucleotidyltransferase family protein [Herbaspirillum sp. WKF16]
MRALLLSAGLGTRLKPLTDLLPKCLVPINGRPLLDFWLENLFSQGIEDILVNTHYRASLVREYLARSTWSGLVKLVHEERLLGTGGTLVANRDFFSGHRVLLIHADNLTRFNCRDFIAAHEQRPAGTALTMMLFHTSNPRSCGIVELDSAGIVQGFHEKVDNPPGDLANAAVYILEPEVLQFIASLERAEVDFSTEVIPYFVGRIFTYLNDDYHRDIGTVASWREAQDDFSMPSALPENHAAWAQLTAPMACELERLAHGLREIRTDSKS